MSERQAAVERLTFAKPPAAPALRDDAGAAPPAAAAAAFLPLRTGACRWCRVSVS